MKFPEIVLFGPYKDNYRLDMGTVWTVTLNRQGTRSLKNLGRNAETWPNFAKWLVWFGRRRR